MKHFYIFYTTEKGDNVYERTCSTKEAAEEKITELKKIYSNSFYFFNEIPSDFKFYY